MDNRVTIYHTNDMHGQLGCLDYLAAHPRESGSLLVDSGDALLGSNTVFRRYEPILERMNSLGYAAMAMGNREFNYLRPVMRLRSAQRQFPLLCANASDLNWQASQRAQLGAGAGPDLEPAREPESRLERENVSLSPWWSAFKLVELAAGGRIALLGATPVQYPHNCWYERLFGIRFTEPEAVLPSLAERLLSSCQRLVLLSHLGLAKDQQLASSLPPGTVIIGGHSHQVLPEPWEDQGRFVVQTGSHGRYLGKLSFTLDGDLDLAYELIDTNPGRGPAQARFGAKE